MTEIKTIQFSVFNLVSYRDLSCMPYQKYNCELSTKYGITMHHTDMK